MNEMTARTGAPWFVYLLGALCVGAIVAAVLVVGPASGSQARVKRTATVAQGVVQSTVSGSGNLQAISQLNLGFKTAGTVQHIYVSQGQQVTQGQLLAALDPQSAEVALEQAKAGLLSARATLAKEEETGGESGGGATSEPHAAKESESRSPSAKQGSSTSSSSASGSSPSAATTTISAATREANLASARAAVRSDELTVQQSEQAVQDTKLYAPEAGTIVSLSGQVGEVVSASGTTRSTSAASSSSSSATGTAATGAAGARGGAGASSSSSGSSGGSGSSSSAFAVLSNLSSMQLVAPLSESEIRHVHVGQVATVTVEALEGRKLAAHVSEVATLATSNSGVVSYDVTFQLDQMEADLRPGMSATAEVVVKQAEGLNVPSSAITADTVTVLRGGKEVRERVATGLVGDSSTIILSGVSAGETVLLPSLSTGSPSTSSLTSRLAGRFAGAGGLGGALGGGALGGGGGGGPACFRGGG